jgi:glycerol-3-phosphate dehydrogenase (NAD(P)+)
MTKYKICSDLVAEVSNGNYKNVVCNLSEVSWYMRNESAIEHINAYKHNPNYLSSVEFDTKNLNSTSDINEAALC